MAEVKLVFGVGDRVIGRGEWDNLDVSDQPGTIININRVYDRCPYLVQFDEKFSGMLHDGESYKANNRCWWCSARVLEPYVDPIDIDVELGPLASLL